MKGCKILIANRGEIACRVARAVKAVGYTPVIVFTEADVLSLHVLSADEKVCLGPDKRAYTSVEKLVAVAKEQGVAAVHPGYGFLSENIEFATAIEAAGIAFLGPTTETMHSFSLKHNARAIAEDADVPVLPGSGLLTDAKEAGRLADGIGYPVLLKATGGGGGIGIYICHSHNEVVDQFAVAARQGQANFGDSGVFLEKYVEHARHIEVQVFGDGKGTVVHLGERECSIQRRHQKIVEETPSPYATPEFRKAITSAAVRLCSHVKYRSAGTVEFLVDDDTGKFYFLEVNTRLQVEHGITEYVSRQDLVQWMLGLQVPGLQPPDLTSYTFDNRGASIEVRINAENPAAGYTPSSGTLGEVQWPEMEGVRVDTWVETGSEVTPYYDSLLAKLMVFAEDRPAAIAKMVAALDQTKLKGIPSNIELCRAVVASERFAAGGTTTNFLVDFSFAPHAVEVLAPGMNTTVQDWPGRIKLWSVGVPPSGPMDARAFRCANALVGNAPDAAGLEFAVVGPTLKFHTSAVVALSGAEFEAQLDGEPVPCWTSFAAPAGSTLTVGSAKGSGGARGYLAVSGGLDMPVYLGSRATFPGGKLGGVQGRPLKAGDQLPLGMPAVDPKPGAAVPDAWRPAFPAAKGGEWTISVLPGPNAEPDYFTPDDIATFYSSPYTVHYNSNRLGVRLEGPAPKWARRDGGEGGSHPSNVHDHVYAVGTINFTGNTPVALMPDGPSLGGFVCPATIPSAELWKMGQVSAGDSVRFEKLTLQEAATLRLKTDRQVELLSKLAGGSLSPADAEQQLQDASLTADGLPETEVVLLQVPASGEHPGLQVRLAGDRYVLVEYGPMELDLNLRVRVWALQGRLADAQIEGLLETSPGVRSVMVEYEPGVLPLAQLLQVLQSTDAALPPSHEEKLPSRVLRLPIAFGDRWTKAAIERYMRSSRDDAPYLPSNIDFVAANNGLEGGAEAVRKTLMQAAYMVLGLGDVYLGAPCAVPLDPRHRLVVPKYNPARTFTPEGAVGFGGAYLCIYGFDSPGGYQLVGRTLPIWNTWGRTAPFTPSHPWLLRIFDQVRFYEVSEEELEVQRTAFATGQLPLDISEEAFDMKEYNAFIQEVAPEAEAFQAKQQAASAKQNELDEASLARQAEKAAAGNGPKQGADEEGPAAIPGGQDVCATTAANVWEILAQVGDTVEAGQKIMVLEAMKMEVAVTAPAAGKVAAVRVTAGTLAQQGDVLAVIVPS